MIRVYLLDDHEVVRFGLREMLEREGDIEVVGESGSAVTPPTASPRYARTSPSSTDDSPTAAASTSAATSAPSTRPSKP